MHVASITQVLNHAETATSHVRDSFRLSQPSAFLKSPIIPLETEVTIHHTFVLAALLRQHSPEANNMVNIRLLGCKRRSHQRNAVNLDELAATLAERLVDTSI
jgi:hypothetical protein